LNKGLLQEGQTRVLREQFFAEIFRMDIIKNISLSSEYRAFTVPP
jgi:hypothetical protein